jgi:hypothetical protein
LLVLSRQKFLKTELVKNLPKSVIILWAHQNDV